MKEISTQSILLGYPSRKSKSDFHTGKELNSLQEFSLRLNDNLCISTTCAVSGVEKLFKPHVISTILDSVLCPKVCMSKVNPEWYSKSLVLLSEKVSSSSFKELKDLKELLSDECIMYHLVQFKKFSSSFC